MREDLTEHSTPPTDDPLAPPSHPQTGTSPRGWRRVVLAAVIVCSVAAAAVLSTASPSKADPEPPPLSVHAGINYNDSPGTGTQCQYYVDITSYLEQDRKDAMAMVENLNGDGWYVGDYGDHFTIASPSGPCLSTESSYTSNTVAAVGPHAAGDSRVTPALSQQWRIYLGIVASVVIGGAVTVAVGSLLPAVAAAAGLTLSTAYAAVIGACIGGIAGNLTYQMINSNNNVQSLSVSSVLSCVGSASMTGIGAWLNANRQAAAQVVTDTLSQAGSNISSDSSGAISPVFESARNAWSLAEVLDQERIIEMTVASTSHPVQ